MTEKQPEKTSEERDIRIMYQSIEKQFQLPSFDTLNTDFDIDTIDKECKHLVKEVAKKIFEHIELFKKTVESILQPDSSILSMQEAEALSEKDQDIITRTARKLMLLDRTLLYAELQNTDELHAEFIRTAASEWQQLKREITPVIEHMIQDWRNHTLSKQTHHYLG